MKLRIHGDNIIECERTLHLIATAYQTEIKRKSQCLYLPEFELIKNGKIIASVELFAGHDRWNMSIAKVLADYGSPLREATDAYITKLNADGTKEELFLAIEYCNALPAGNNAWQRNGRAISCAELNIPYLYFAEIGGVELDEDRNVKAPRFPNPIVPFSYLTASLSLKVVCIPVYESHPAITEDLRKTFTTVFGLKESLKLIKALLDETDTTKPLDNLIDKGTALVKILSDERKRIDTLKDDEWASFLKNTTGQQKANWLSKFTKHLVWKKKQSEKVNVTSTFKKLLTQTQKLNCLSVGASEIPICLIPTEKLTDFATLIQKIYPKQKAFHKTLTELGKPLLIVWITGFKPRGDDSRPDRGLVPLARMLFGNSIDILSVVFGPAKPTTWKIFKQSPEKLALDNGLWQAVIGLSNFVFADSPTSEFGELFYEISRQLKRNTKPVIFESASATNKYSEQDTDTAIHSLFSKQEKLGIFESMCNPPGGDWSGVSVLDFKTLEEYRWTSLPRVSAVEGKRPDHVIQIVTTKELIFLAIESKDNAKDLEKEIGTRLVTYLKELLKVAPTAHKIKAKDWKLYENTKTPITKFKTFSGAAFCFKSVDEIDNEMEKGNLDFVMAFEFKPQKQKSILHLKTTVQSQFLVGLLAEINKQFVSGLKIEIH